MSHPIRPSPNRKPETPTRRCRCCLCLIGRPGTRHHCACHHCACHPLFCAACQRCEIHCRCDK